MMPSILSIGTAAPSNPIDQKMIVNQVIDLLEANSTLKERVRKIYEHSSISTRHTVLGDLQEIAFKEKEFFEYFTTKARNTIYKDEAPKLAKRAALKALEEQDVGKITHLISVSCTGMMAPGIEFLLIKELGLSPYVSRLGINFMGCFGAFSALKTAFSIAKENPSHHILIVCTELCSLHFQTDFSNDSILANSLFSDGAAAILVTGSSSSSLFKMVRYQSMGIEDTLELMSWGIGDSGFTMTLSERVPVYLKKSIDTFANRILEGISFDQCNWAIHPGGKSILQAIEKKCQLSPKQTQASWRVLSQYGNMSSATFLFVLEELLKQPYRQEWTLGIGVGPGLTLEALLLKGD